MNAQQRKSLAAHVTSLRGYLQTIDGWHGKDPGLEARKQLAGQIEDVRSEVENEADEERSKFDNMSEGLQQGDNGQRIEQAADALDTAQSGLYDATDMLEAEADEDNAIDFDDVTSSISNGIDSIEEAINA